jgi:cytochrome P450
MATLTQSSSNRVVPGPAGHPLIGNLIDLRRNTLRAVDNYWRTYGDVVRLRLGPVGLYLVSNPVLVEDVLIHRKDIFPKIYRADGKPIGLQLALGNGLLTNPDDASWLTQRRMMQPMFHRKRIATMSDKMADAGGRMLQRWAALGDGGQIELNQEMMLVTMDIISRTMFSSDVLPDANQVGDAVTTTGHFVSRRMQSAIRLPLSLPTPANQRYKHARRTMDSMVYGFINERRATGVQHGDLLDMLLEARDEDTGLGMTDQQIRDEVATIFGAGHETTANGLTWTWVLLAQHPEQMAKLQAEVDRVLEGRPPTLDDVPHLTYTAQVFQEALRLYPPVPLIARRVTEATTLGEFALAPRHVLFIGTCNIHRHPDFWRHPEVFDPERFTPEAEKGRQRMAYMPFGGGPHLCIGNHFAQMEGTLLLAMMAQHYTLKVVPGHVIEPHFAVTMRPRYGVQMTLHRR